MDYYNEDSSAHQSQASRKFLPENKIPLSFAMFQSCINREVSVVDQQEFGQAILLGRVVAVKVLNMKTIITFTDELHKITMKKLPGPQEETQGYSLRTGQYIKAYVNFAKINGQLSVNCKSYELVTDANAVSDHLAQIILRHLERKNGFRNTTA